MNAIGADAIEAAVDWETGEDERHLALTDDGWALALYRYRAAGGGARPFPVVIGHGFAGSRYLFDCHADYSLARALAARGYDSWLVDLRGRNDSWPVTTPFPQPDGTRLPFSSVASIGPRLAADRSEHLESSFRPANTDWVVAARYFRHGVPDEATDLVDQFRDWILEGVMRTRDGAIVYSDHLGAVRLPILVMVGAADLQRPPDAVRSTFDALGSADKTFVRVGTTDGFPVDAGHDDLVAGRCSPTHVYPLVADWLDERSAAPG